MFCVLEKSADAKIRGRGPGQPVRQGGSHAGKHPPGAAGPPAVRGASAYGLLGECLCAVQNKSWGPLVGVEPIEPDFPFDGQRIQYRYHQSSRYNRRFEQRQYLKRRLGKGLRKLVGVAMGRTQALFLKHLSAGEEAAIRARLQMGAREFWRVVKGGKLVELPPVWVELSLFDMMEDDHHSVA